MIVINTAWRGQRVTGQQRYASELSSRLLTREGVTARPRVVPNNRLAAWGTVQLLMLARSRGETLVTLTSRGPLWHPRHVVTIHDHFVLTNPEWYTASYVSTHAPILKAQIAGARGLVFVSEATKQRHHELFGADKPSVVAPNGVHPPRDVRPYVPEDGRSYLLAVASLDPRKNLSALLQAYAALPATLRARCPLLLAGGQSEAIFKGDVLGLDHIDGVRRLGYVDDDTLWSLYRGARALLLPSLDEGFGLPLVEAAAMGTPLVISDIPVFRWIAGDTATYFDPRDVESIREALARAITNDHLPLLEQAADRFSWDGSAERVWEFLQELP